MTPKLLHSLLLAGLAWGWVSAWAQQGIYTCVDKSGRRITSDRPILECIDREQKELTPSGTVKRTVRPAPTAEELAKLEEDARKQSEERARVAEERRRERAMLSRYPNRAAHDKERADSLAQLGEVAKAANARIQDLLTERKAINAEAEFYKNDPSRMPLPLRRRIEENDNNQAAQRRFLRDQDAERARINARFDEELALLRTLWSAQGGGGR